MNKDKLIRFIPFKDRQILLLLIIVIVIALVFTTIGLRLYNATGSAQIDLSRPDYQGVGEIVQQDKTQYTEYSATGDINKQSLSQFKDLFDNKVSEMKKIDAFGGSDVLSPEGLSIDDGQTQSVDIGN